MDLSGLPPLSGLRAFEAAARLGSFTGAGAELNVTHAAISQQVRRLESHLGIDLMRRRGRGLELTEAGARLAERLSQGFAIVAGALAEITETDAARPLKIALTPMFTATWLMPRLGAFRAAHPDVEITLDPRPETVDLHAGGHDLAIRYGQGAWPGLEARRLLASNFVVVVARKLIDALPAGTEPSIGALPWLQEQGTDELRHWMAELGLDVGAKTDITHLPGYLTLPALLDGQGVAATTRAFVENDIREGRLVVLHEDPIDEGSGYYLAWPADRPLRPAARAFIRWIEDEARRT